MISRTNFIALIALLVLTMSVPVFAQDETTPMPDSVIEFNITLSDYNFTVAGQDALQPLQLQAGQTYRLHLTSTSLTKIAHEILFGKNPNVVAGTSHLDFADSMLADVEVLFSGSNNGTDFVFAASGMKELEVAPGQELTLEFTLPNDKVGDWEIGCFEFMSMTSTDENPGPSHYDVGMHLPVIVSAAAS
jgi:hypothetical protein